MKFKGITVGTYISKRPKGKYTERICADWKNNKNNMNYTKDAMSLIFLKLALNNVLEYKIN